MARTIEQLVDDMRFLKDCTDLAYDVVKAVAYSLEGGTSFGMNIDEPSYQQMMTVASALKTNATADGTLCMPPGPCDAPTLSIKDYMAQLHDLNTRVTTHLGTMMEEIESNGMLAGKPPKYYPSVELKWPSV